MWRCNAQCCVRNPRSRFFSARCRHDKIRCHLADGLMRSSMTWSIWSNLISCTVEGRGKERRGKECIKTWQWIAVGRRSHHCWGVATAKNGLYCHRWCCCKCKCWYCHYYCSCSSFNKYSCQILLLLLLLLLLLVLFCHCSFYCYRLNGLVLLALLLLLLAAIMSLKRVYRLGSM